MKDEIINLRNQGLTYDQIKGKLGSSKGTIAYHLGNGQKDKTKKRTQKNRNKNPLLHKLYRYKYTKVTNKNRKFNQDKSVKDILYKRIHIFQDGLNKMTNKFDFTVDDLLAKIGNNPVCYLTGREIDLSQSRTYEFDHKIPKSKGGDNSLDNLGLCCKEANQSKRDMSPDEYINLCKQVLEHNGYEVNKK